jgi:hypothetical protein
VCFTDGNAGPDWPGLVAERTRERNGVVPCFLQGHCGDVNPGGGKPWLGDPEKTAEAIHKGMEQAIHQARPIPVDTLRAATTTVKLPLDIVRFRSWIDQYAKAPSKCARGPWVDAGFAADWAQGAAKWDLQQTTLSVPISALRLGDVGLLFHPSELYSYYGLAIRRDSALKHTLVVAYTDDIIGYLPDPRAYRAGEYAAITVPKIIDLPPFTPDAASHLVTAAVKLIRETC